MQNYKFIILPILFLSISFAQDPCECENDFTPVCGIDGFTYPNECIALCFGVEADYDGDCTPQCNAGEFFCFLDDEWIVMDF